MRIVFFGTPEFAVPSLEALVEMREAVVLVVTQPDRPRGRSHSNLEPSPVKARAASLAIPVAQPDRPRGPEFLGILAAAEADLGVVVAYGHLLKPEVLAVPRLGMINVHASLLPRWRGAAPIQWAIASGDSHTGITIMQMDAGLDTGPTLLTETTPIGPTETAGELTTRLARLGAAGLGTAIRALATGEARFSPQPALGVTVAPKIGRESARVDWTLDAATVVNRIRAFDPVPGAWTETPNGDLKLFRATVEPGSGDPGLVQSLEPLAIATGKGIVTAREVKPAGRSRMAAAEWARGRPFPIGTRLR
jgi:methionyl-tRNA formyltransferase